MPYWIIHLKIANKKQALEKICKTKEEKLDFFAWNIFVDISYNLKQLGIDISRQKTHYYLNKNYFKYDFEKNFLKNEKIDNCFKLWYFYHLVADKIWRDIYLKQKIILEKAWLQDFWDDLYQAFRKYYAFIEFKKFKKNNKEIIEDLYNYKIKKEKLPKIFQNIPENLLKKAFLKILDHMIFKENFYKKNEKKFLEIKNNEIILKEDTKKFFEKYYPKKYYDLFYKKILDFNL